MVSRTPACHRRKSGDNPAAEGGIPLTNKDKPDLNGEWLSAQDQTLAGIPACEPDKYREYVEDFDLSEAAQTELLQTLWSIMAAFVNLGFGVDSVQLLEADSGQTERAASDARRPQTDRQERLPPPNAELSKGDGP